MERLVMYVIELGTVVNTGRSDRVSSPDELLEKRVALLAAIGDASEGRILAFDAQSGVPDHKYQEAGLALREAVIGDRLDAFIDRHSNSSSANPGSNGLPPRLLPPLRPPIRALLPR
jgi:hypothetical protein